MNSKIDYSGDIIADIFSVRGIDNPFDRMVMLSAGELPRTLIDEPAKEKIEEEIESVQVSGKKIIIFADYDADGICSGIIANRMIPDSILHIPERKDGYGLTEKSAASIPQDCGMVFTVDCGIQSKNVVAGLAQKGIKVIVTDHHQLIPALKPDCIVVHPDLSDSSFKRYAGAGVAYKISKAMGRSDSFGLQLAAIGTICDVMPMLNENRLIVRSGLIAMRENPIVGIKAIMRTLNKDWTRITETDIGFYVGPTINACGRMGNANLAKELMNCDDDQIAMSLASEASALNQKRKEHTARLTEEASENIVHLGKIVISVIRDHSEGVIGLVATELNKIHGVPAIVFSIDGDEANGSCRAPEWFDCGQMIKAVNHIIVSGGGHAGAAGLKIKAKDIRSFTDAVVEYVDRVPFTHRAEFMADISIGLEDIPLIYDAVGRLKPFGHQFESPIFASVVFEAQVKPVGKTGNHSKIVTDYDLDLMLFGTGTEDARQYLGKNLFVAYELLPRGTFDKRLSAAVRKVEIME